MVAGSRASLIAAASVAAVEALKDQVGLCRWNYALRSLHQHARNKIGSLSQVGRAAPKIGVLADDKGKRSEESLRTVMYLSCWGPN